MIKYQKSILFIIGTTLMVFGEFTTVNVGYDFTLIAADMMYDLLCVCGVVALILLSRKMGERIRGSVYWVLFSIVFASFFKGYVIDILAQAVNNLGFVLYYAFVILSKRFYSQLLTFLVYAAFVACPFLFKVAGNLFKGKPLTAGGLSGVKFFARKKNTKTRLIVRPSFHFIS